MMKKTLSIFLAVAMLVGFMPLTVSANPSISLDKAIYAPGEKITVATSGITQELKNASIWVGIYNIGDPYAEKPISSKMISAVGTGRVEFTDMLFDGGYEMRLITGLGNGNWNKVTAEHIITSIGFTVDSTSVAISLDKFTYAPGEKITVTTSGITSGMVSYNARLGIYNPGDPHSVEPIAYTVLNAVDTGRVEFIKMLNDGNYEMRLYRGSGSSSNWNIVTEGHHIMTVLFSVDKSSVTITLDKTVYAPGETIVVTTSGITSGMVLDKAWMGIYNIGDPHSVPPIAYGSVQAMHTGRVEFDKMLNDGSYEMRLYRGTGSKLWNSTTDIAGNHIMTVLFSVDKSSVTIALDKTVYAPGEKITVTTSGITSGMVSSYALVGIYNLGDPHTVKPVWYVHLKAGTNLIEHTRVLPTGNYEMRLYRGTGSSANWNIVTEGHHIMTVPFTVGDVTPTPDPTPTPKEPNATYTVTVSSIGTGATGGGSYEQGATVNINAGTAPTGQQFKNWTTTSAGVTFANAKNAITSFVMPAGNVTVTAVFEPVQPNQDNYSPADGTEQIVRYTVLVLDVSPSMATKSMEQMKKAANEFVSQMFNADGKNYVAVVAYSQIAKVICDFSTSTSILSEAIKKVDSINRHGTDTYAGLSKANEILSSNTIPTGAIKNIVLMTDGMPNLNPSTDNGPYTISDCNLQSGSSYYYAYANSVYNLAKEIKQSTTIYALGFFQDFDAHYPSNTLPFAIRCLQDIASSSSYYYEVVKGEDLEFVFGQVAEDVITKKDNYFPIITQDFNGNTYAVYDVGISWHEAKAYCESVGGHLATLTSKEENDMAHNLIKQKGTKNFYWIGATDELQEGRWQWVTGENWSYTNWESGQPDNRSVIDNMKEDYLTIRLNGRWNDLQARGDSSGSASLHYAGFICEWENTSPTPDPTPPDPASATGDPIIGFKTETINVGVKLWWNPLSGGVGYRVYRSQNAKDEGISVTDFYITYNEFVDVNVKTSTTYYYSVRQVIAEARPFDGIPELLGPVTNKITVKTSATILGSDMKPPTANAVKNFILMTLDDPIMAINGIRREIDPGRGTVPLLLNSRTMVPIRAIVEGMGGTVGWDDSTRLISLDYKQNSVRMWLDKLNITVNGVSKEMDVAPTAINGRTMVPIRFAAENLGCTVDWLNSTRQVVIVYY